MLNVVTSLILSVIAVKRFNEAVDSRANSEVKDIVDVAEEELRHQGYKDGFKDGVKDALLGNLNKFQAKGC